jgi:hypothetical protein
MTNNDDGTARGDGVRVSAPQPAPGLEYGVGVEGASEHADGEVLDGQPRLAQIDEQAEVISRADWCFRFLDVARRAPTSDEAVSDRASWCRRFLRIAGVGSLARFTPVTSNGSRTGDGPNPRR